MISILIYENELPKDLTAKERAEWIAKSFIENERRIGEYPRVVNGKKV